MVGEESAVKVNWEMVDKKLRFGDNGKKWSDFVKADMAKLDKFNVGTRYALTLAGIACCGATPMVSASNCYNQAKALLGRVYRQQKPASWGKGPKPGRWQWAKKFVPQLLPEFEAEEMERVEWLNTMPSHRKKALLKALLMYERRGLKPADAGFKAFVKGELLPGFSQDNKVDLGRLEEMLDRLIQGPSDISHVVAGPVLKPLMRKLKKLWTMDHYIHYGSCGPEGLHKLLEKLVDGDGTFYFSDFSMFDNTHSDDTWDFMEGLYGYHGVDFAKVMAMWRAPQGKIGPFKYQAKVMNASGRDDTALANAILNGFATYLSVAAAYLGKPLDELSSEDLHKMKEISVLSVCGDDTVGKLPKMSAEELAGFERRYNENIREFGFEAKLETCQSLNRVVYLGQRPYPVGGKWYWGKTIGRATYKMGWIHLRTDRDEMAHITGVADMHVLCSSHVPILSDLAAKIVDLRQGAKRTPIELDPCKPWEWTLRAGVKYDDSTIEHVAAVYSELSSVEVTSADVRGLIREIQALERLPAAIDSRVWRLMIASDDL